MLVMNTPCISEYQCKTIVAPEDGAVLAPWVSIDFVDQGGGGAGDAITVGNNSSTTTDPANCAVIKSFDFGHSDGVTCRVVIHDTHGGAFEAFMSHLVKDWQCLKDGYGTLLMKVNFGWCKAGCNSPDAKKVSPDYYVMCDSVEANFSQGKFIFEITGQDICKRMFEGGSELQLGGEGQKGVYMLDAMKELMTVKQPPTIGKVSFKMLQGGTVVPGKFKANTAEEQVRGPKGKWDSKGKTKMEAARQWAKECPSINGRSWIPQFNFNDPTGELIFWENTRPDCGINSNWDEGCLGTYVVNAGKNSPVIEFNPKIKWDFAAVTAVGGAMGDLKADGMQTAGAKNPGADCLPRDKVDGAGQIQQTNASDTQKDRLGSEAVKEAAKADIEEKKTIRISSYSGVEADLVVIGDPLFAPPMESMIAKNVAIVLINPFHIVPNGSSCGEWLSGPTCNDILSNKGWIITSVTHKIEAGVYTTTIGVNLTTPGIHVPTGTPLGAWAGGWKPVGTCS